MMNIYPKEITIRELVENYDTNNEVDYALNGNTDVYCYNNRTNVRPKYQRDFRYSIEQQLAVIKSIMEDKPINVMYWAKSVDDTYEVLDGQQRILSICECIKNRLSINDHNFDGLPKDIKEKFLNYKLFVYICEGTDSEKLDWFRTINISSEQLTEQELRNAIYTGPWLTHAKEFFSKRNSIAHKIAGNILNKESIKQEYLETAIKWKSKNKIEEYMQTNQNRRNANPLITYFKSIFDWIELVFPEKYYKEYHKFMRKLEWNRLYDTYHEVEYDIEELKTKVNKLMMDEDIEKKSGIFEYVLSNNSKNLERLLNIRAFSPNQKIEAYERQEGICPTCNEHFELEEMEGDHITPWSQGGKTTTENLKMLCRECNRRKSDT